MSGGGQVDTCLLRTRRATLAVVARTLPFRFGVELAGAPSVAAWRELAREAESLGYSVLCVADHFGTNFAPLPALTAAAEATSSIRLATMVLANDYRHPLVLAQEVATLDVLSEGRFELGIGAGWMRADYEAAGIDYDGPGVRVERLEEAVQVLRGALGPGPFTFAGKHYRVDCAGITPPPVQAPVPILIGGGGRRVLSLAGYRADIVSINFNLRAGAFDAATWQNGTTDATIEKLAWVRAAAGNRADDIEYNIDLLAVVTDDRANALQMLSNDLGMSPGELERTPHALVGSVNEVADTIIARREAFGFSYITVTEDAMRSMAPVVARLAGT
jgi:probable F420-dependent oxidoreductase